MLLIINYSGMICSKGTVYSQSLPFLRLADEILKRAPRMGGFIDGDNFLQYSKYIKVP